MCGNDSENRTAENKTIIIIYCNILCTAAGDDATEWRRNGVRTR